MKTFIARFSLGLFFLSSYNAVAQFGELDSFVNDMRNIADDFASPAAEGAAYQAGGGWFTSAESLELWQLDISVHANVLFVPNAKTTTSITNSDLQFLNIQDAEGAELPTAFGSETDVMFEGEIFGEEFSFDAIDGIDKKTLIHPFLQASVGLPFGTEVTVRLLPQTKVDGMEVSTYGIGLKHNFNQYFLNPQPSDFQFAALLSFSKYDVDYQFSPIVIDYEIAGEPFLVADFDQIEVDANIWLFQLITSKTFRGSNWTVFGAAGATMSDFEYMLGGEGIAMAPINSELETLSNNEMEFKGDLGVTYEAGNFLVSSMFSQGKFSNLNLSLHYRL